MKPPGWLVIGRPDTRHTADCQSEPHVHMSLRVRKWHPGFWLFVIREFYRTRREA